MTSRRSIAIASAWARRPPASPLRAALAAWLALALLLGPLTTLAPAVRAQPGGLRLPFAPGAAWYVAQGYNTSPLDGLDHYDCDPATGRDAPTGSVECDPGWQFKYALDLRRVDGQEAGQTVFAPAAGVVAWLGPDAVLIDLGDDRQLALLSLDPASGLAPGVAVAAGQPLGAVLPSGVGLRLALWQPGDDGRPRASAPFTGPAALAGYDFPPLSDDEPNQYWNFSLAAPETGDSDDADADATDDAEATPEPIDIAQEAVAPTLALAADRATVGTPLTVNGSGFAPGEPVALRWDGPDGPALVTPTASDAGAFTATLTVPEAAAGDTPIVAIGERSGSQIEDWLEVIPALAVDPPAAAPGDSVTIELSGFGADEAYNVYWAEERGPTWASGRTDANGSARVTTRVPDRASGVYDAIGLGLTTQSRALGSFRLARPDEAATPEPLAGEGRLLAPGTFRVTATVEGMLGGSTSSGETIDHHDRFVSLPACTTTSCPWLESGTNDPLWGTRVECGDRCFVKVVNPENGRCAVAPVLETGPWFTLDDWWNPADQRRLNALPTTTTRLAQGYPGAEAAQDGLDVGFGRSPEGVGISNKGYVVGNPSAMDLSNRTWQDVGFDLAVGIGTVEATMLWMTGEDVADAAQGCRAPDDAAPDAAAPAPTAEPTAAPTTPPDAAATATPEERSTDGDQPADKPNRRGDHPPADKASPAATGPTPQPSPATAEPNAETDPAASGDDDARGDRPDKPRKRDRGDAGEGGSASSDDPALDRANRLRDRHGLPPIPEGVGTVAAGGGESTPESFQGAVELAQEGPEPTEGDHNADSGAANISDGGNSGESSGGRIPPGLAEMFPKQSKHWPTPMPEPEPEPRPDRKPRRDRRADSTPAPTPAPPAAEPTPAPDAAPAPPADPTPDPTPDAAPDAASASPAAEAPPATEPSASPAETPSPAPTPGPAPSAELPPAPSDAAAPADDQPANADPATGVEPPASAEPAPTAAPNEPADATADTAPEAPTAATASPGAEAAAPPAPAPADPVVGDTPVVPPAESAPTAAAPDPTPQPTPPVETPAPPPTETPLPTPAPAAFSFQPVADASVHAVDPDAPEPANTLGLLDFGGPSGAVAYVTFNVEGVAPGRVASATLVLTGAAGSGPAGTVGALPGYWVDEAALTYATAPNGEGAAADLGAVEAGVETAVDVTGVVTGDGLITFVLRGVPDATHMIGGRDGATPPRLEVTTG